MHAHHHQMMQRQGYARSVHDYIAPDLALVDMNGETTTLKDLLNTREPVMMNFIFTTCTTICPVLSATFSQVQHELGPESEQVRMISITIDPEQDTPQRLKRYAERYGAGSQWRFLTGERDHIVSVEKAFDIYRGSKSNHEPITLLRGAGDSTWVRLDGIASASDIIGEYHKLDSAGK
jgi:protein SCO1